MIISIHVVQVKHILQMKAKFPHKNTNLLYELTQIMVLRVFQVWVEETVKEWVVFWRMKKYLSTK